MPDSKPNTERVKLLKDWLFTCLRKHFASSHIAQELYREIFTPEYINERFSILRRSAKDAGKAWECDGSKFKMMS